MELQKKDYLLSHSEWKSLKVDSTIGRMMNVDWTDHGPRKVPSALGRPVREGVSKGEENGRRPPALRAGHPPNGRKAQCSKSPPDGRKLANSTKTTLNHPHSAANHPPMAEN